MYLLIYLFTCLCRQHLFTWFFVSLLMQTYVIFDVLGFKWKDMFSNYVGDIR